MAAVITPYYRTPKFKAAGPESTAEMEYRIRGSDDETEVLALLAATAPAGATADGWLLTKVDLDIEQISYHVWRGTAHYSKRSRSRDELQTGESSFSFEVSVSQIHVTYALATTKYPVSAPDYGNAINYDGTEVKGVDIHSPTYSFSETHILDGAIDIAAYKQTCKGIVGRTNNATFKGSAAGEVLCLGISGSMRGDEDWEITYNFAESENETGLTVAGITGIAKTGWQYLWVDWATEVDVGSALVKPKARGVYVETVYKSADYSGLGIGT